MDIDVQIIEKITTLSIVDKKTFITSDCEGFDITSVDGFINEDGSTNGNLYVLGDVVDSTSHPTRNIKTDKILLEKKSFNLRNLRDIVIYKNIFLIFGNREINKLKCKWLTKLAGGLEGFDSKGNSNLIKQYNDGIIRCTYRNYRDLVSIVKQYNNIQRHTRIQKQYEAVSQDSTITQVERDNLLNLLDLQTNWHVQSMTAWYGHAGGFKNPTKIRDWTKDVNNLVKSKSAENDKEKEYFFYKRFQEIFGLDNALGTMSAGNLLYTIPIEIGLDSIELNIKVIASEEEKDDFRAFIVLSIFRSMFLKPDNKENNLISYGLYYKLFADPKNSVFKILDDSKGNVFLLSHGGVSSDILGADVIARRNELVSNEKYKRRMNDASENIWDQSGGFYKNQDGISFDLADVKTRLEDLNAEFYRHVMSLLGDDTLTEPNEALLFVFSFMFVAPFTSIPAIPMMPGFREIGRKNKNIYINDKNVYNIFGHQPNGVSAVVDYYESSTDLKCFEIDLDTSNSFSTTNWMSLGPDDNYFLPVFVIDPIESSENCKLKSIIKIDKNIVKKEKYDSMNLQKITNLVDLIYYSNGFNFDIDIIFDQKIGTDNKCFIDRIVALGQTLPVIGTDNNHLKNKNGKDVIVSINFSGIATNNKTSYNVISLTWDNGTNPFMKNIFILNNDDFMNFVKILDSKTGTLTNWDNFDWCDKGAIIGSKMKGRKMDGYENDDGRDTMKRVGDGYYEKYIKYKNKYLSLKKSL